MEIYKRPVDHSNGVIDPVPMGYSYTRKKGVFFLGPLRIGYKTSKLAVSSEKAVSKKVHKANKSTKKLSRYEKISIFLKILAILVPIILFVLGLLLAGKIP
jgi:hypothetical protein